LPPVRSGNVAEIVLSGAASPDGAARISFNYALMSLDPTVEFAAPTPEAAPVETFRLVRPTGAIVRHLSDGTLQVLHRNGNIGERRATGPHANCWISTNERGIRKGTRDDGTEFFVPCLPVTSCTDPITHNEVTTRGDGTMLLARPDGSRLTQFADGTAIDVSAEAIKFEGRGALAVSCAGYPDVAINLKLHTVGVATPDGIKLRGGGGSCTVQHPTGLSLALNADGTAELTPAAYGADPDRPTDDPAGIYLLDLHSGSVATKDPEGSAFSVVLGKGPSVELVLKDFIPGAAPAEAAGSATSDDPAG